MCTVVRLESSKGLAGFRVLRIGPVNMGLRVYSAESLGHMTEQLIHMLLIGAEHQIFSGSIRHMLPEHTDNFLSQKVQFQCGILVIVPNFAKCVEFCCKIGSGTVL